MPSRLLISSWAFLGLACLSSQAPQERQKEAQESPSSPADRARTEGGSGEDSDSNEDKTESKKTSKEPPKKSPSPKPSPSPQAETKPTTTLLPNCAMPKSLAEGDVVIFDASKAQKQNNLIRAEAQWQLDEAWGGSQLELRDKYVELKAPADFHGFKFTPPQSGSRRLEFSLSGARILIQASKKGLFGLRMIKPSEFEGNGGAPTTTWLQINQNRFLNFSSECVWVEAKIPANFAQGNANRIIFEIQNSQWNSSEWIRIYGLILSNYQAKNP